MNYHLIDMQVHGDRRGKLISLEGLKNVPFEIKRIYYMFDTLPNEARGFHAHKELEQIIIAMDGASGPPHYIFLQTFSRHSSRLSQSICFPEIATGCQWRKCL